MMNKALSVALCLLMAGTVLTACSNPDEFSDSENLSLQYTRSDKTDDTFNYADGAKTAPSSCDTYSAKITDFELRLFRNRHKSGSYVFCPANAVLNLEAMANGASGDTQEEITNALCSGVTLENMNQCASYFASRIQSVASCAFMALTIYLLDRLSCNTVLLLFLEVCAGIIGYCACMIIFRNEIVMYGLKKIQRK